MSVSNFFADHSSDKILFGASSHDDDAGLMSDVRCTCSRKIRSATYCAGSAFILQRRTKYEEEVKGEKKQPASSRHQPQFPVRACHGPRRLYVCFDLTPTPVISCSY